MPTWNEIPKDWNPDATPEQAEQMGKDFDAQIQENAEAAEEKNK